MCGTLILERREQFVKIIQEMKEKNIKKFVKFL